MRPDPKDEVSFGLMLMEIGREPIFRNNGNQSIRQFQSFNFHDGLQEQKFR